MADITFSDLQISYAGKAGPFVAVDGFDARVEDGEFVTIVGASGCGKSSVLLAADGLLRPSGGEIRIGEQVVTKPGPDRGVVFQDASLMPWRTILANVAFGLEMQGVDKTIRLDRARHFIELVGLAGREEAHPHQLSGGMRQRVGIARALATDPEVLLMDEPFGALDAQTRELMAGELLRIWDLDRKTVLFVTHGIDEAVFLADRVLVMGGSPSRVVEVIEIDLPRPRDAAVRASEAFGKYRTHLADLLLGAQAKAAVTS
ncbi:ABC transporter ATP-binding protein [Amycolatopsis sp. FDAARGOS 1241]|uniref:ABC transporter ATP-binding protein n=1 Tax=Amycolatopsis sp. FDAARGOS 1241 TaxID=2778070 RepID=UPI001950E980|nr:ABC transporter ATP-binding protein [Amycolatopsis sp. FDAARGOS 1241]QRP43658.1 ABC transporter ATP-binding protein [Amycolatopsis sp. FDAARGOS 1241]